MNLLYRIILKVEDLLNRLHDKAYIEVCKSRGLKIGKDVINIEEQFDNQKIFNAVENVILKLVKPEN